METIGWLDYYTTLFATAFLYPLTILDFIAIGIIFAPFVKIKWLQELTMKHWFNTVRVIAIVLFVLMVIAGVIRAPYVMYQEKQLELETFMEEHRPNLSVDPIFVTNEADEENRLTNFVMNVIIDNIGDRPAHQVKVYISVAPLFNPELHKLYLEEMTSPIYPNIERIIEFNYNGSYSLKNDWGVVMVYLRMEYSNTTEGKSFEPEESWMAVTVRWDIGEFQIFDPSTEEREQHRHYIEKLLQQIEGSRE